MTHVDRLALDFFNLKNEVVDRLNDIERAVNNGDSVSALDAIVSARAFVNAVHAEDPSHDPNAPTSALHPAALRMPGSPSIDVPPRGGRGDQIPGI